MIKTPENLSSDQWYEVYRRSIIERHIASNGRFLQNIWLAEPKKPMDESWALNARASEERLAADNALYEYIGYPVFWNDNKFPSGRAFPGGGDNPLLQGGLCMAAFAMETLRGVDSHSFEYAKILLKFVLESELRDTDGKPTGLLTRQRHYWRCLEHASTDELTGCLLGLYLLHRAAFARRDDATRKTIETVLGRIARFLQSHNYIYVPDEGTVSPAGEPVHRDHEKGMAFIFLYPISKLFEDVLGDPHLPVSMPEADELALIGDMEHIFSTMALTALRRAASDNALGLYTAVLELMSTTQEVSGFDNYYNFSMTCHSVVLALLNPKVGQPDRVLIAEFATRMLMAVMRFPDQPGHENAYFAVVARFCLPLLPPGGFEAMEQAAAGSPTRIDDDLVRGSEMILGQLCRASHHVAGKIATWGRQKRKECSDRKKGEGIQRCKEKRKVESEECKQKATREKKECERFGILSFVCVAWVTIKSEVCVLWQTVTEWVCVAWETVYKTVCDVGTWVLSGLMAISVLPLKLVACRRDQTWEEHINNVLQTLIDPRDVWFRDLPLGATREDIEEGLVAFRHSNSSGENLVGEQFTWEHRDPQHCFTVDKKWENGKAYGELGPALKGQNCELTTPFHLHEFLSGDSQFDLKKGFRCEAAGMGYLYPRMLLAFIDAAPNPIISDHSAWPTLPFAGASIQNFKTE